MSLTLRPPQRSLETLRAIAASGASGLAREAQAELIRRRAEQLRRELGR